MGPQARTSQFLNSVTANFPEESHNPSYQVTASSTSKADAKMRCGRLRLPHEPTRFRAFFRSVYSRAWPRRPDCLPSDDVGLRRAVGEYFARGRQLSPERLERALLPHAVRRACGILSLGDGGSTARFQARSSAEHHDAPR